MKKNSILTLVNVSKTYNQEMHAKDAVAAVNFSIPKNDFCVIMGGSGSGKTTLLNPDIGLVRNYISRM